MSISTRDPLEVPGTGRSAAHWFAEKVQPHQGELHAFLHARFPALTETDDLVQESYVRLLRAHHANPITNVKSFLFTTARNLALDFFRRGKVISIESIDDSSKPFVLDSGQDLVEGVCHDQELKILQEAIAALPERCREVLSQRKLHGLPRDEIARRMGISANTVNAQIAIGMLRCRRYFEERGLLANTVHKDDATKA